MKDTPETDALREAIDNGATVEAEMTSLAIKLERERDEARKERDQLKQLLAAESQNVDAYLGVCIERDEARRELKLALEQWELCIEMSKK